MQQREAELLIAAAAVRSITVHTSVDGTAFVVDVECQRPVNTPRVETARGASREWASLDTVNAWIRRCGWTDGYTVA